MDSLLNKFTGLHLLEDDDENEEKRINEQLNVKISNLDKLLDELNMTNENSLRGDLVIKPSMTETGYSKKYPYKNYFINCPTEFPWKKAMESGEPMETDLDIDYENIFDDVGNLTKMEKQLQLLYRPFTCTLEVSCRFNMYELCLLMADSRYDPCNHPSVVIKVTHPSAQVKVHAGGKIVSTALNANSARTALFKVVRILQDLDYKADMKNLSRSIVNASFSMPFKINLDLMISQCAEEVTHNRNQRPFITYTTDVVGVRFAVFPTGYILVLHSNSHFETREAIAAFLPILAKFKNGCPSIMETKGSLVGDLSYMLLWEKRLEEDKEGLLLYS
ncbi:LOW QUALITY PROTEIN: uncharacterized protein LOC108110604 [Drosophila eugracilis]|uniref:LOW QUALITY PROTEIN: uncharacterized protein LOC108110604 n=1 Tax=Drosophila eugracilis TaxID=29029 RepID=UPI0007E63BAD|nr:LOW QUALITY PROTEIN: uncharacterized protein LOC108110604 [Drosophila eugracilis]